MFASGLSRCCAIPVLHLATDWTKERPMVTCLIRSTPTTLLQKAQLTTLNGFSLSLLVLSRGQVSLHCQRWVRFSFPFPALSPRSRTPFFKISTRCGVTGVFQLPCLYHRFSPSLMLRPVAYAGPKGTESQSSSTPVDLDRSTLV